MEKQIIEIFKKDELWCAVLGRDSREGSFGSGYTLSEALRRLAHDIEFKDRGILTAQRAAMNGRGSRAEETLVREGMNTGPYQ
jgi:hypothetical protein